VGHGGAGSYVRVEQALDSLTVDVSDEVTRSETGLGGGASFIDGHDQMVQRVKVGIAQVDADGSQSETESAK
jgi:hypothetical protein